MADFPEVEFRVRPKGAPTAAAGGAAAAPVEEDPPMANLSVPASSALKGAIPKEASRAPRARYRAAQSAAKQPSVMQHIAAAVRPRCMHAMPCPPQRSKATKETRDPK